MMMMRLLQSERTKNSSRVTHTAQYPVPWYSYTSAVTLFVHVVNTISATIDEMWYHIEV